MFYMTTTMTAKKAAVNMKYQLQMGIFQVPIILIIIRQKKIASGCSQQLLDIESNWSVSGFWLAAYLAVLTNQKSSK